jgi:nicotinamidase-related amidase
MRIIKEHSIGLVVDIQERLLPHMHGHKQLISNVRILLEGLRILEVPLFVTEQYRKGLGATVVEIQEVISDFNPMEKMAFSCCDDPHVIMRLNNAARRNVILCGIEAHVCILQTVLDLLDDGYQPVVVGDCISSRKVADMEMALSRMRQEGAIITSYESVLFELARVSGTDTFRAISRLVK